MRLPLSSVLAPLLRRGARKNYTKCHEFCQEKSVKFVSSFFCLSAFISVYQRLIYRLNDFVKSSALISTTFFSNFDSAINC